MLSVDLREDCSEIVHYDRENYPIYIRKAHLSSYNNFAAPPHWHDDAEFIRILQGRMEFRVNEETVSLGPGEGLFVNSRQLHYGFSQSRAECRFLCALLHPRLLCALPAIERNFVDPLWENQSLPCLRLSGAVAWQGELLAALDRLFEVREREAAPLLVSSLFFKIWALLLENANLSAPKAAQSADLLAFKEMIGYIQRFYRDKITLQSIARAGAVGQSKCCRLFHRYISQTPNAYLTQYRLNQSLWFLKNTDKSITEIAQLTGFSGSSYYAEAFRKWAHKSPSAYRKEAFF